jgi:DNA gyrase subunit A
VGEVMSLAKQTVVDTDIRDVIYGNYMPYAVKVLLDRAIPDLQDGLKPSQRRILYTMYKQKLFNNKTKSANVVGEVMKLHPHGDMAIYETMTRMTDKYGAWNFPLIYGKGNFGSVTSNFASAAPRYTEAMLEEYAKEYFEFLDSVEMLPSYDNKNTEPKALPVNFPAVLANPTEGIAVGFATSIPSFNVIDLIEATKAVIQGKEFNYMDLRPDFPTGGSIVALYESMKEIWTKGKGSIPIYATYSIEQKGRYFEMVVTELPYGVIIENVIDGLYKLAKRDNYFKTRFIEARDESGIKGFKLVIKFNGEPDAIVNYVLNKSDLQKNYPVNINVIDGNSLKQIGVRHLLREWCKWRKEIVSKHFKMLVEDLANKLMFLQAYMSFMSKVDIDEWVKLVKNEDNDIVLYNYLKAKVTPFNQQIFEFLLDLKIKDIRKFSFGQKKEQVVNLTKELQRAEGIVLNPVPFIVDELSGLQVKFKKKGYRQKCNKCLFFRCRHFFRSH